MLWLEVLKIMIAMENEYDFRELSYANCLEMTC
jgi:hypothetical protein